MVSGISAFTNLPMPVKVGLLVVSGGGIVAALGYILPPEVRWIVYIGLAVVALLVLLYWRVLKWLKKRKAAPMERDLMESTSAAPQGISKPAHMARLDDLRKQFENGVAKFQAAGKSLYGFPWYAIVGEPGSGKTEAIRHCNVGFPPGLQDEFQGTGGTINMNWWFTDHAVILDTAGRLMFDEVETGGSREWKEFLSLLKRYRTRCPINGVLLVIPADSLIKDTADEIEQKASKIARQFDLIQRTLDVRFPVFVVVTKSDLINGFRDFFDSLDDPQLQHQILGWSNPAPLDEPYNPDFVDQHLKAIRGRLFRRRLALMQEVISEEPGAERMRTADTLYAFPQSIMKIAPRMARYLELIFSVGSQWSCKPLFFRGIYFTSSMREGSALDEDLAESLGVPVDSLPDGRVWERDRAYFLRDLFMKKIFREHGLVTYATNATKQHTRRKAAILVAAAASVVLLLFFTFYAASRFSKSIGKMGEYLRKSAALIDPQDPDKLRNEVQIIKKEGEGSYRYIGRAGISGMPEDVKRFNFSARLAEIVRQWEEKGVPWIFAPAAKFTRGIKREKLNKAQAVLFETGALQPLLDASRDLIEQQQDGKWTREDLNPTVLRQLVRIKANKSLDEEGEYSAASFLEPLFKYVFRWDEDREDKEDFEKRMKMYREDSGKLHQPLGMIYGRTWPPTSLKTDPNSRDPAIARGVKLFVQYWDPNRSGAYHQEGTRVETVMNLKASLEKFGDAEERILGLRDRFDMGDWDESFVSLKEARENIRNCAVALDSPSSLGDLWIKVANDALREVNENYEFLLNELRAAEEPTFLAEMRSELEEHLKSWKSKLDIGGVEEKLKRFDREFWAQLNGRRLYEIRFEMYSTANEQLSGIGPITGVNQVSSAIREVDQAVRNARQKIEELLSIDPLAFRCKESHKVSNVALDFAKRRRLYAVVEKGLEIAPRNGEELANFIEKQAPEGSETIIPGEITERRYDPTVTVAILDGWKLLGDTLNYHFPEDTHLKEIREDANSTYAGYTGRYLDYWLETIPERWITNKIPRESNWKARHRQLEMLDVLDAFRDLKSFGEALEDSALDKFKNYILDSEDKIKRFRDSMEKLSGIFFQRKCERTLQEWAGLSDDAFEARNKLLAGKPISLIKDYFPFVAESGAEFVDRYWARLTIESAGLLADQTQDEAKQAVAELKTQYGSKFPLERESAQDLTFTELRKARSLLGKVRSWEQYAPETIGGGAETGVAEVDEQLALLREVPLPEAEKRWVEAVEQVFQGLPQGEDPYYCKVILLGEKEQRRLQQAGEQLLLDYLTGFRIAQGTHQGERFNTRTREHLKVDVLRYPAPPLRVEFYQYPSDTEPRTSLEFSAPWACLRVLQQCYDERQTGLVKLSVKSKEGPGGVLYLHLEFCKDNECKYPVQFPKLNHWPSLKRNY